MRILIVGAAGRLGSRLYELLSRTDDVIGVDLPDFDMTDFAAVQRFISEQQPEIVITTAAWTDVDGCALDPQRAIAINGFGAQNLVVATAAIGAAILYVSTNEVFNGELNRPYYEYDSTGAVNPYGYSKLVGERAVMSLNPRHYVVRTSWLFAHGGRNFLQVILNAASQGKTLRVVTDEVANPTYNDDLAEAINALVRTGRYGIYHLVNEGACSRYAFARYILDCAGYHDAPITPISRYEWHRPSKPPVYSGLANLAGASLGIRLRPWQEAVEAFLLKEGLHAK